MITKAISMYHTCNKILMLTDLLKMEITLWGYDLSLQWPSFTRLHEQRNILLIVCYCHFFHVKSLKYMYIWCKMFTVCDLFKIMYYSQFKHIFFNIHHSIALKTHSIAFESHTIALESLTIASYLIDPYSSYHTIA